MSALNACFLTVALAGGVQETSLPERTLLYVEWPGVDAVYAREGADAPELMSADAASQALRVLVEPWLRMLDAPPGLPETVAAVLQHPFTLYVREHDGLPNGQGAFVFRPSAEHRAELKARLEALLVLMPWDGVTVRLDEDLMAIWGDLSQEELQWLGIEEGAPEPADGASSTDAKFDALNARAGEPSCLKVFFDIEQMDRVQKLTFEQFAREHLGGAAPADIEAIRRSFRSPYMELIEQGFTAFGAFGGFEGGQWKTTIGCSLAEGTDGIVRHVTDSRLTGVLSFPSDATSRAAVALDVVGLFDQLPALTDGAMTQEDITSMLLMASMTTGLDVRSDVLSAFGREWGLFLSPSVAGPSPLSTVAVHESSDGAAITKAMNQITPWLNEQLAQSWSDPPLTPRVRAKTMAGCPAWTLELPGVAPCVAVKGDRVLASMYPMALQAALMLPDEAWVPWEVSMAGDAAPMVQFDLDPRAGMLQGYSTLLTAWQGVSGWAAMWGSETDPTVVPSLSTLRNHLTPVRGTLHAHPDALALTWTSAAPLSELTLLFQDSAPLMAALLLGNFGLRSTVVQEQRLEALGYIR